MGMPLHLQVAAHPGTSTVTALCVVVWLVLLQHRMPPAAVGLSYQRFVADRQWWRALTAQVSHFELLHLLLNVSSLWSLAHQAEPPGRQGASLEYLRLSALLLLASAAICLALHHVAIAVLGRERLRHTLMVGYSCVLFGWMTLLAWRSRGSGARFGLLGTASLPLVAAPLVLLLLTQLLVPTASFLGHVAGILAGLLLASGCLDWLTPYWTACLMTWVGIGVCYGLALEGRIGMPYIRLLPYGNDSIIENGSETAQLADLMERGGSGGGTVAAAEPARVIGTAAAVSGTARSLASGAAAVAAAVAGQMRVLFGAARHRMGVPASGGFPANPATAAAGAPGGGLVGRRSGSGSARLDGTGPGTSPNGGGPGGGGAALSATTPARGA